MDKPKQIELALVEWTAKFNTSSKKTAEARSNFENLFQKWKDAGATFEDVYETYLPKAIKVHLPTISRARDQYKRLKKISKEFDKSEKEFIDDWNKGIESIATDTFFEFFPATPLDHDPEPKVYGNMSMQEYKAQRRYADQFPTLDTRELVKAWREKKNEYNLDVDKVLDNVLGDKKNETDS